jgi:hypothetical protein
MNRIATYGRVPIKGSNCKRSHGHHQGVTLAARVWQPSIDQR